jgi:hypothetical protein
MEMLADWETEDMNIGYVTFTCGEFVLDATG